MATGHQTRERVTTLGARPGPPAPAGRQAGEGAR